jgi:signal recognition particle subunit SRP19
VTAFLRTGLAGYRRISREKQYQEFGALSGARNAIVKLRSDRQSGRQEKALRVGRRCPGMVENVIWPAALDADLTRSEGRRVSRDLAVSDPTVDGIAEAVQQVGYDAVVERGVTYPREYEPRGRVLVKDADDATKSDLLGAVAAYLGALRA